MEENIESYEDGTNDTNFPDSNDTAFQNDLKPSFQKYSVKYNLK